MTLLVTGFEPFGPVPHNPSAALLAALPDRIAGVEVKTAVLPVDSAAIGGALRELYAERPEVVLHLGVARERPFLSLERVAKNRLDFDLPDNAGRTVRGAEIVPGAPPELSTRLPTEQILGAWAALGIPARPSDDAGLYLCNQAFFLALHHLPDSVPAGFVHVAPDETLARGGPHVPLAAQARAVVAAAEQAWARAQEAVA